MNAKRSWLQRLNLTLASLLAGLAWSGCGWTRPVPLPNGYICNVDKFIWIDHPDHQGDTVSGVGELDVHGDVVIGTQLDWESDEEIGYFILDTNAHDLYVTRSLEEFAEAVADRGIENTNLRWPGVNFNGPRPIRLLVYALLAASAFGVFLLLTRSAARREADIRQNRLDRL
ncbi:MAG: hypothetical protein AB8F26_01355 [Phycisphaerales bacterium]